MKHLGVLTDLEARRLVAQSVRRERVARRFRAAMIAETAVIGAAGATVILTDRPAGVTAAVLGAASVAYYATGVWFRRSWRVSVDDAERWYIENGPDCTCGCPRRTHQGVNAAASSGYAYFDGPCINPDCPGCPNGYRPVDGRPYRSLFPPDHVYRHGR